MASATSRKMELTLTGVARASLEELLLDYEDFLRQGGLPLWDKNSSEALSVRSEFRSDPCSIGKASPEVAANTLICLINQASHLLRRQLERLEQSFLSDGGFTERLYRERQNRRYFQ
ncbi:MAG: hypothetical protein JXA71_07600 [Chitinispirillaceae bacterium]|nr:hypothetical protein [Chitinispirillaceae bacterium]